MNLKEMTTEEIAELVGKKRIEIMELIENIEEQTELKCYGTLVVAVEDKNKDIHIFGGGSGGILEIAKLYKTSEILMAIANAAVFHKNSQR